MDGPLSYVPLPAALEGRAGTIMLAGRFWRLHRAPAPSAESHGPHALSNTNAAATTVVAPRYATLLFRSSRAAEVVKKSEVVHVRQVGSGKAEMAGEGHRQQRVFEGALGGHLVSQIRRERERRQKLSESEALADAAPPTVATPGPRITSGRSRL